MNPGQLFQPPAHPESRPARTPRTRVHKNEAPASRPRAAAQHLPDDVRSMRSIPRSPRVQRMQPENPRARRLCPDDPTLPAELRSLCVLPIVARLSGRKILFRYGGEPLLFGIAARMFLENRTASRCGGPFSPDRLVVACLDLRWRPGKRREAGAESVLFGIVQGSGFIQEHDRNSVTNGKSQPCFPGNKFLPLPVIAERGMGQGADQRLQHRPMRTVPFFGIMRVHRAPGAE